MKKIALATTLGLLTLAGCSKKNESYTTDYLLHEDKVRQQVLDDCKGKKQSAENCSNAIAAERQKHPAQSP